MRAVFADAVARSTVLVYDELFCPHRRLGRAAGDSAPTEFRPRPRHNETLVGADIMTIGNTCHACACARKTQFRFRIGCAS